MNVMFKDLCEFIQKRILHSYTFPKSRSNGGKQDKLLQNFPILTNNMMIEQLCLKPSKIGETKFFVTE